jgi:hypothetical protein
MPRGYPKKFELRDEPLVRVVVYVEPHALEQLQLLVRYRFGPRSRSAIVRQAITSELARHAAMIIRYRRRQEREQREAAELQRATELSVEERVERDRGVTVSDALAIVREAD